MNTLRDLGRPAVVVACTVLGVATAACGGDDDTSASSSQPATAPPAPRARPPATTSPPTVAPVTTVSESTTSAAEAEASSTTTIVDDSWKEEAAAMCAAYGAEVPSEAAVADGAALFGFWHDLRDRLPWFDALDLPDELRTAPTDVPAVARQADEYLARAEAAVAAGDDATVDLAVQQYLSLLEHSTALLTIAGAECGDRTRAANATLNVPIPTAGQVATGLGSVWVSQGPHFTTVARVDPDSGNVLATIDLGVAPFKIQPADGRMIVRTADAYMAIDPTTNSIVGTLAKSDVGPAANRSWAVDGAMWICDGQRLHRYDPATFAPTGTVIELGIDCGQVYATGDLVVAWTYNEDDGESGTSAAVFVDPTTNQVLATTPLPADVTVPIVLDDAVFFPAQRRQRQRRRRPGDVDRHRHTRLRALHPGQPDGARRAVDLPHRRRQGRPRHRRPELRGDRHDRATHHRQPGQRPRHHARRALGRHRRHRDPPTLRHPVARHAGEPVTVSGRQATSPTPALRRVRGKIAMLLWRRAISCRAAGGTSWS